LVFHAYIKEMHSSRSKIPSKKISSGSIAWKDLIPALKAYVACACLAGCRGNSTEFIVPVKCEWGYRNS
jgi:hypothetical protein